MLKKTAELVGSKSIILPRSEMTALRNPSEYYETLKKMIAAARSNVTMSALYLGCGSLENGLIDEIEKALSDVKRPNLKVTLILDHSRALRGEINSATLCSKIIKFYPTRFSLLLYQVPQLRNSAIAGSLPGQLREVLGVYHCKFNVFDNTVILTGANLSNDYFTDRQDRYLKVNQKSNGLAAYLMDFTSVITGHCHRVTHDRGILPPSAPLDTLAKELVRLNAPDISGDKALEGGSVFFPVIQHSMMGIQQERNALLKLINATTDQVLVSRQNDHRPAQIKIATPYTSFKSSLMQALIRAATLASLSCKNEGSGGAYVTIINPSAQAHGFAGASGVKSLVPKLHQCAFEQAIEDHSGLESGDVSASSSGFVGFIKWVLSFVSGIASYLTSMGSPARAIPQKVVLPTILEFTRDKWTFHTKGMWFYPPQQEKSSSALAQDELPELTYIGSSNFGARSWTRDFELGFILASEDQDVRQIMHLEHENIERWCNKELRKDAVEAIKLTDVDRLWLPSVTRLVKSFL